METSRCKFEVPHCANGRQSTTRVHTHPTGPLSTTTSALDGACSGLNPYAGLYTLAAMKSWGDPIGVPIFQPSAGTSNSTSSGASIDQDSNEDYHEIGDNVYWNPAIEAHRISMVGPSRAASCNSSSRYPTIRGSEASNT
jgi:hypothetical protein